MPLFEVMDSTKALMDAAKITKRSLKELLRDNQIDTDEALGIVSAIAHCGDSDAIKLRAAEMALKMSGDLEETAVKQVPVVNIIINDTQKVDINPILIPRNA
jgi:hypothetical protein